MVAEVTDNVGVQGVLFEVTTPTGFTENFRATQTPGTNLFTAIVLFDMSGAFTTRVAARDFAGNTAFSDRISFTVENIDPIEPTTVAQLLASAGQAIRQTITQNRRIAATYVRLGFHDCAPGSVSEGSCDGCINLDNPANNGLGPGIQALAPIVDQYESTTLGVSRADLWAYAALVAAEVSQNSILFTDGFNIGRVNCENSGNPADQFGDFPADDIDTHEILQYFADHFGFDAQETVAIMVSFKWQLLAVHNMQNPTCTNPRFSKSGRPLNWKSPSRR
jgi:hypothetical protein